VQVKTCCDLPGKTSMSSDNKTEQATPRRREKAREQGQVARSRELPAALAVATALLVLGWTASASFETWREYARAVMDYAARSELHLDSPIVGWTQIVILRWIAPSMLAAWLMALAGSLAQGGILFAPAALSPNIERFSPSNKLKQLFSLTALSGLLKSLIPGAIVIYLALQVATREWPRIVLSSRQTVPSLATLAFAMLFEIGWKSALTMLVWSGADYLLVRQKHEGDLKMSREELREEMKQSEGNPAVKGRIRRLQRQVRRRRMMQDVQKATVVVVNPTHFAIAIQYEPSMQAPVVVAKGRNLLAEQIKQAARWHGITIIENPPLAHALYRAVQVGQAIPSKLYTAVAEILAFVFRAEAAAKAARAQAPPPEAR
jgi:flagellar biosynthetic protein FlhB